MGLFLKAAWGVFLKCRKKCKVTVKEKQHIKISEKLFTQRIIFSPLLFLLSDIIFSFIPHSKRKKKNPNPQKVKAPSPVVGDLFVFLIG